MKVIKVMFTTAFNSEVSGRKSKKEYCYFVDFDVQKGDTVIVFAMNEYKSTIVTQITGLSRADYDSASKLAVCAMDPIAYAKRVEALEVIMEIKNELRTIKEQQDDLEIYRTLAKGNPRVAELMDRLSAMDDSVAPLITTK